MNKAIIFGIFLISIILISGAGCKQTSESLCKSPYIEYQKGNCCLDSNTNSIRENLEKEYGKKWIKSQPIHTGNTWCCNLPRQKTIKRIKLY